MKALSRNFLMLILTLFSFSEIIAQSEGVLIEGRTVNSTVLNKSVKYSIYLPPDYSTSSRKYPVVYLLHGYSDDQTAWSQFGEIKYYADKAIESGLIPSMIIVMPDAGYSWYCNSYDGKENYEDFFIKEFIPFVDTTYHTKKQKIYRAVSGLSMGGFGSMFYAIKYPQFFGVAAPLSAGVLTDDEVVSMNDKLWETYFSRVIGPGLKGKDRLDKYREKISILEMVSQKSKEELSRVRFWIDCGDDDDFIKGNCFLHLALTEKGVPHEFRVRDGFHTWSYWRSGITNALEFIGKRFRN
ncbi:MAG: alpha/beta hydrolase-fold protein [Ginsengibacter sp.]